jgi:hypothetical protein
MKEIHNNYTHELAPGDNRAHAVAKAITLGLIELEPSETGRGIAQDRCT